MSLLLRGQILHLFGSPQCHFRSLRWSCTIMSGVRGYALPQVGTPLTKKRGDMSGNQAPLKQRLLPLTWSSSSSLSTYLGGSSVPAVGARQPPVTLVKVGSDGKDSVFWLSDILTLDRMALLKAIRAEDDFGDDLKDVPLIKCAVLVVRSAYKVPSEEEEKTAVELIGEETIEEVLGKTGGIPAGSKVFLRVKLPPLPMPSQGDGPVAVAGQDAPLKKLHLALLSASLEPVRNSQSGAQLLRLPSDVKWPQLGSHPLFVRHFYKDCVEGAMSNMQPGGRFIVRGNGGIGKSAFGLYLLWRAVISKRTVIYVSDKVLESFIFHADGRVEAFPPLRANFFAISMERLKDPQTLLIFDGDGDGSPPPIVEATTILITSPKLKRYSLFEETGTTHLIFPVFARSEIQDMLETCFPHLHSKDARSQVKDRYKKWGGIPRYVLALLKAHDQSKLDSALTSIDLDKLAIVLGQRDIEDDMSVSHRLVHLKAAGESPDGFKRGADDSAYALSRTEIGSPFIAEAVCRALLNTRSKRLMDFLNQQPAKDSLLSTVYGQVFERHALKVLLRGGKFETYKLQDKKRKASSPPVTKREDKVELPPSDAVYFNEIEELMPGGISDSGDSAVDTPSAQRTFVPRAKNFAAIDFILPGQRFVNVTINDEHALLLYAKKGTQGLVPVAKALGIADGERISFFWVMPRERYDAARLTGTPFPVKGASPPHKTAGAGSPSASEALVAPAAAGSPHSAAAVFTPDIDIQDSIDQYLLLIPFEEQPE